MEKGKVVKDSPHGRGGHRRGGVRSGKEDHSKWPTTLALDGGNPKGCPY